VSRVGLSKGGLGLPRRQPPTRILGGPLLCSGTEGAASPSRHAVET
jgi:hypothetical protein